MGRMNFGNFHRRKRGSFRAKRCATQRRRTRVRSRGSSVLESILLWCDRVESVGVGRTERLYMNCTVSANGHRKPNPALPLVLPAR
jgi:hypothetical protein